MLHKTFDIFTKSLPLFAKEGGAVIIPGKKTEHLIYHRPIYTLWCILCSPLGKTNPLSILVLSWRSYKIQEKKILKREFGIFQIFYIFRKFAYVLKISGD